jgi:hypothetical protein
MRSSNIQAGRDRRCSAPAIGAIVTPRSGLGLMCAALLAAAALAPARADGSLEIESGGTFLNAGFINHPPSAGSSASSQEIRSKRARGTRVASLGGAGHDETPKPGASLSGGGGVRWIANSGCLASNLRGVIDHVAQNYGSVTVSSTCRSRAHNRRVGGAPRSYHLTGDAVDFRVRGNVKGAYAYLRSSVGGLKHYGGGLFHIDNGDRRSF